MNRKEEKLTGRLDGRPCMLSSWLLLLEAMGWLDGGAVDWELKESWESSYVQREEKEKTEKIHDHIKNLRTKSSHSIRTFTMRWLK